MYILAPNQIVEKFPYSINELRKDHPEISFPANPSNETLEAYNVFPVVSTGAQYDPLTQIAEQVGCLFNKELNRWQTAWVVRDKTDDELQSEADTRASRIEEQRANAYRNESDPIFFKYQREEATKEEWLDKIAEIKAKYPD
jgi:hypothetical protein